VGVVWGEGTGPASQGGQAAGADLSVWIQRLIRAVRQWFFMHGGA
jgi:hypothetical protein